ncbi:hypothetical protein C4D60_Mb05t28740 [Musa balbisiana]|uniref:Uncharacterized protein n=1 Tax=Musa balbisiana TaxID=52838 RepID=A0A4S8JZJ0_MUSBA|nr:hypothetical protein C4D60_Mb05t28740 [Musa balbisiana]
MAGLSVLLETQTSFPKQAQILSKTSFLKNASLTSSPPPPALLLLPMRALFWNSDKTSARRRYLYVQRGPSLLQRGVSASAYSYGRGGRDEGLLLPCCRHSSGEPPGKGGRQGPGACRQFCLLEQVMAG